MPNRSRVQNALGTTAINPSEMTPGENIECAAPRCLAKPQRRYSFPVPLCGRHLVRVLSASIEVAKTAQRDHVVSNMAPLTIGTTNIPKTSGTHDPVVYYLRFGDRIKIGTTTNLRTRLISVPCDEVLAVEPGSYALERERHEQFAGC